MPLIVSVAVLAVSAGLILLYAPGFAWQQQQSSTITQQSQSSYGTDAKEDEDDYFIISGENGQDRGAMSTKIRARLYKAFIGTDNDADRTKNNNKLPPVVIMAHGMGLIQDFGLLPFIEGFNGMGIAVVTFDYPNFGASDTTEGGNVRHAIIPSDNWKHIRRVVEFLQQHKQHEVDTSRIALWGTSLAGGHVLECAALAWKGDNKMSIPIKAVVSNVPHIQSGLESILPMFGRDPITHGVGMAKILVAVLKQLLTPLGPAWYVPLHGIPGSSAIMQNSGDDKGYGGIYSNATKRHDWRNGATVLSAIRLLLYRPINSIRGRNKVLVPTLLVAAQYDTLCPLRPVERAARLIPNAELVVLPNATHFDVYHDDEVFKMAHDSTLGFLAKHLLG